MVKKNKNIVSKFLQGWQQLFGADHGDGLKPFPESHFYSPEELEFLSTKDKLSTVEQWAVAKGRWAYAQSREKLSDTPFTSVKWQDGLMATYIDGRLTPDTTSRQAEKLMILKEQGYGIPEKYENIITDYEANRLIGKHFSNPEGGCIIKVASYQKPRLLTDMPKLIIQKWDDNLTMSMGEESYSTFKEGIGKDYIGLTEEEERKFVKHLTELADGKKLFAKTMSSIRAVNPPLVGSIFETEQRKALTINNQDDAFIPMSWSLDKDRINILGHYKTYDTVVIHITADNAYKYGNLLTFTGEIAQKERVDGTIRSLVNILGNNFGEIKMYANSNNSPLIMAKAGIVNAVITTKDGNTVALDLSNHQGIALSKQERKDLMTALVIEGKKEQTALVDKISVPQMKDYIESLRDKEDIFSGETDYLPVRSTVNKLFCEYERLSEEYHTSTNSGLPMSAEDRNEMFADLETSYLSYKQELSKMVEAYTTQPSVEEGDVHKLECLDAILDNNGNQELRPHKNSNDIPLTQEERNLRDSLVKKLHKQDMGNIPAADSAIKEQEIASSPVEKGISSQEIAIPHVSNAPLAEHLEAHINKMEPSRFEDKPTGRWHQPEIAEKAVYLRYGNLLSERLSLQLTYEVLPWIKNQNSLPRDLKQKEYGGITSLMLALDAEKNGYALPIYINQEDAAKRGLVIKASAEGFPVITAKGIKEVYNIEQTNYPNVRVSDFEDLKMESIAANRYQDNGNDMSLLLKPNGWPAKIQFDGKEDLASYSYKTNSIHIAPEESYQEKDKLYRDLSEGLVRSTRSNEAKNTKYEAMVKEELISLVGSVMLGQKMHFEVTTPQQSGMWKDRLKTDPAFTKQVLTAADKSVRVIHKRVNDIKHSVGQDLDIRSTTPIDYDVDGNGIVESQENYAPDKKQGANENSEQQSDDIPQQEKRHHRMR